MAAALASIAVPSCRKMCCLNGSKKLLSQKIFIRPYQTFVAEWIFRTECDFLQVLDLLIFRQKQPGHWAEVVCHFHLLVYLKEDYFTTILTVCGFSFANLLSSLAITLSEAQSPLLHPLPM